jgi:hypothetical protein
MGAHRRINALEEAAIEEIVKTRMIREIDGVLEVLEDALTPAEFKKAANAICRASEGYRDGWQEKQRRR